MGIFDFMTGGDASKGAQKYYDQIPGQISPYYNPYINSGRDAMNTLNGQYGKMINDPGALYASMGKGYKESPGFQFKRDQMTNTSANAAAAGGMIGSPQHQQQSAEMVNGLASQDFDSYMDRVMGLYGGGINGLQGMNQMGYDASMGMADNLANMWMNKGNMAYAGRSNNNKANMGMWGLAASGAANYATGGASGMSGFGR